MASHERYQLFRHFLGSQPPELAMQSVELHEETKKTVERERMHKAEEIREEAIRKMGSVLE